MRAGLNFSWSCDVSYFQDKTCHPESPGAPAIHRDGQSSVMRHVGCVLPLAI